MSPTSARLVRRRGISAFSQTLGVVQVFPVFVGLNATVGPPLLETMTVSPYISGVYELLVDGVVNGRSQSSAPLAKSTPTTLTCVRVTTCLVPPMVTTIGEP